MSNSLWSYELYPARLLCPWDFPGKNTGVGCLFLRKSKIGKRELPLTPSPRGSHLQMFSFLDSLLCVADTFPCESGSGGTCSFVSLIFPSLWSWWEVEWQMGGSSWGSRPQAPRELVSSGSPPSWAATFSSLMWASLCRCPVTGPLETLLPWLLCFHGSQKPTSIILNGCISFHWVDGQTDGHRSFNHLPMVGHLGSFQSFATVPNDKQPHLSASVDLANFHPRRTIATSRVGACLNLNAWCWIALWGNCAIYISLWWDKILQSGLFQVVISLLLTVLNQGQLDKQ